MLDLIWNRTATKIFSHFASKFSQNPFSSLPPNILRRICVIIGNLYVKFPWKKIT